MTPPEEPQYPGAPPPPPPQYPQGPPQYPQAPPEYPQAPPQAPPPQYPQQPAPPPPVPPQAPPAHDTHQPPPQQPPPPPPRPQPEPEPPSQPPPHPHEMRFQQRRVVLADHQRGADAAAVSRLLLHVPNFVCSLLVVTLLALFLGGIGLILVLLWLVSGVLVFHRPTESVIARHFLRLRYPTPDERARLEPVWHEVSTRAGVVSRNYELWIEDSDHLNAVAAAGHIVGVTRFAVQRLPSGQLAAVLAHELGHHIGGHSWSSLLGYWYALPGRVAWRLLRGAASAVRRASGCLACVGVGMLLIAFGGLAMATVQTLYGLPLLILVMPYALAAVGRQAELRADQQAAALGFAPMLVQVLGQMHQEETAAEQAMRAAQPTGAAGPPRQESLSRLLASHPDYHTRLRHLEP
ncbi:M48 family metalloprotease, partial [Streptomyces sp. NPDC057654]|uniref:M48 family metalloprotease n=1 Tax=Streptomyces sp. NPDC057654 TaxID=3346196 RepID=UPI00369650CA